MIPKTNQTQLISILLLFITSRAAVVTTADFLYQPTSTGSTFYNNVIGATLYLEQILPYYNSTLFQGYFYNSILVGQWDNAIPITIRTPKGWFYNCTLQGINSTDTSICQKQLKDNTTFWAEFGQFIWNTQNQPYWTFGLNNQHLNFTNSTIRTTLNNYFMKIYRSTYNVIYCLQAMYQADKAVINGMRTGTYTIDNFLTEVYQYQNILFGIIYKAPGISQDAGPQWMTRLTQYYDNVWYGLYTFDCVIFMDPALATIQNLLDDNYTRGYLRRRFKVNQTFTYTNVGNIGMSLSRIRLTNTQGIDGITNTFAAALWWIDFICQCGVLQLYDISIQSTIRSNNYQSLLGPAPGFMPSSLYYATIFTTYAVRKYPKIIIPSTTAGLSDNIKVWGFQSPAIYKFLIINKDMNVSLNGKINIIIKSTKTTKAKCIYLEAPSLTSKADQIKLAGHYYIAGNATPQGTYKQFYYEYNTDIKGYSIDIKYAQAVTCQIPNADIVIPVKQCYQSQIYKMGLMVIVIMGILIGFI